MQLQSLRGCDTQVTMYFYLFIFFLMCAHLEAYKLYPVHPEVQGWALPWNASAQHQASPKFVPGPGAAFAGILAVKSCS